MALSVLSRHILLCFLALILAVSATKWLDGLRVYFFLREDSDAASPLFLFPPGPGQIAIKGADTPS